MPPRIKLALGIGGGVLIILLAAALASVGAQLDQARIEQTDFETDLEALETEVDELTDERDTLQETVDEQLQAIEQLKADLERQRGAPAVPAQTSEPPAAP